VSDPPSSLLSCNPLYSACHKLTCYPGSGTRKSHIRTSPPGGGGSSACSPLERLGRSTHLGATFLDTRSGTGIKAGRCMDYGGDPYWQTLPYTSPPGYSRNPTRRAALGDPLTPYSPLPGLRKGFLPPMCSAPPPLYGGTPYSVARLPLGSVLGGASATSLVGHPFLLPLWQIPGIFRLPGGSTCLCSSLSIQKKV